MDGRGRDGWRWVAASVLVTVLVLGLGFVLRVAGLGAAANAAQLVSVIPLLAAVINWARIRHGSKNPLHDPPIRLGELLRTIADAQGLTGEDVRTRVHGWGGDAVDAYLDGTRQPAWDFVVAFLDVIAPGDRWHREVLERRVRPAWKAASGGSLAGGGEGIATDDQGVVVVPGTGEWVAALRKVISTRRVADGVQVSISRHEALGTGLAEMLDRLAQAVTTLAVERDHLREVLAARQADELDGKAGTLAELGDLRRQLQDIQQRLDHTERVQAATAWRLEKSERQRRLAERLKDDAIAQAADARQRLAELEHHPTPNVARSPAVAPLAEDAASKLMGDTDRQVAEKVLDRIDDMLRNDAVELSQFGEDLMPGLGPWQEASGGLRRRFAGRSTQDRAIVIAVGAGVVVIGLLFTIGIVSDASYAPRAERNLATSDQHPQANPASARTASPQLLGVPVTLTVDVPPSAVSDPVTRSLAISHLIGELGQEIVARHLKGRRVGYVTIFASGPASDISQSISTATSVLDILRRRDAVFAEASGDGYWSGNGNDFEFRIYFFK